MVWILIILYFASVFAGHLIANITKELKFESPKNNIFIIPLALGIIFAVSNFNEIISFTIIIIGFLLGALQKDLKIITLLVNHLGFLSALAINLYK